MVVKQRMAETNASHGAKTQMGLRTLDKGGVASCLNQKLGGDDSYA